MTTITHTKNKRDDSVSLSNGYWFYFTLDGQQVAVFGSAWSGRETVFVNDEVVSNIRNLFSLSGKHHIEVGGKRYTVTLTMENILTGKLTCEVRSNGKVIAEQSKGYITSFSVKEAVFKLVILFLAGYGAGNLAAHLVKYLSA